MNYSYFAALIRGLCIDLTGMPQFVVYESAEQGKIPPHALTAEIGDGDNEESATGIILKAYSIWKLQQAVKNANAPLPSCVAVLSGGEPKALYWTGSDLDSARKRLAERNDTPRAEVPAATEALINAAQRAAVVKNRISLVTGGAQGIGEEIVRNLAATGAVVFIADLNLEGAQKLADQINAAEKRTAAIALEVNVCDEASVEAMFDNVAKTAGGLDLCISNAGVLKAGSVLEQGLADFKFVTDINYTGFFVISKFAGRILRAQYRTAPRWKTDIIQVNSKSGLEGSNKSGA
jgi:sorbitol-6-phosphate 2-dehydrogenase